MKCAAMSSLVFFVVSVVGTNAWSAVDIFVFGRYEEKWGGPLDNLIFGLQLSAVAFVFSAFGSFISVFVASRWFQGWQKKECCSRSRPASRGHVSLV